MLAGSLHWGTDMQQIFYSPSTGGFYADDIHDIDSMPADRVQITVERWQELLTAQAGGKKITTDNVGNVVAVERPALSGNDLYKAQIMQLEMSITPRRLREAMLGTDSGWLANVNSQIEGLRIKLT